MLSTYVNVYLQPPTNVVFPSLTAPCGEQLKNSFTSTEKVPTSKSEASCSRAPDARSMAVLRKPPRSARGPMIPLTKGSARMLSLQTAATTGGQSVKSSILITKNSPRQNFIPPLEYYAKGPLLKIPERSRPRNHPSKTLAGKKLNAVDAVLSPDKVNVHTATLHVMSKLL